MNIEEERVFLPIQFKNPIKVNKLSSTIERRLIGGDGHLAGGILRDESRISVGCATIETKLTTVSAGLSNL